MKKQIVYLILAHEKPDQLRTLLRSLLNNGSIVAMHYDKKQGEVKSFFAEFKNAYPDRLLIASQVSVEWGEWTVVEATINCLKLIEKKNIEPEYVMLLSGSTMPIRPLSTFEDFLSLKNFDYIECVDAAKRRWIVNGIQKRRYSCWHFINWRKHPYLFSISLHLQKFVGINRKLPMGHRPFIGSQWWCLRWKTIQKILDLLDQNSKIVDFYKRTWVPDELFFQTIVGNLVPYREICSLQMMMYEFDSMGVAKTFYAEDIDRILKTDHFFARKISLNATSLKSCLERFSAMSEIEFKEFNMKKRRENRHEDKKAQKIGTNEWCDYDQYLQKLNTFFFVVLVPDTLNQQELLKQLNECEQVVCHGRLLHPEKIEFVDGNREWAGYNTENIELRDDFISGFLLDIFEFAGNSISGFIAQEEILNHLSMLSSISQAIIINTEPETIFPTQFKRRNDRKSSWTYFYQYRQAVGKSKAVYLEIEKDRLLEKFPDLVRQYSPGIKSHTQGQCIKCK